MLNGQLSLGLVEVVAPGTHQNLGYVFTEQSGSGQLQRWLLHQAPNNHFELKPPPADMASWNLSDWIAGVARLWTPNSFYVKAQTDVYFYGREYNRIVWTSIPPILPNPTYPDDGGNFQLDPVGWNIIVTQWTTNLWGMAYTEFGLSDAVATGRAKNAEYWLLPNGFAPAGTHRTTVSVGSIEVPSRERFVALANGMWAEGATFAITGCNTYFGALPPRNL